MAVATLERCVRRTLDHAVMHSDNRLEGMRLPPHCSFRSEHARNLWWFEFVYTV